MGDAGDCQAGVGGLEMASFGLSPLAAKAP